MGENEHGRIIATQARSALSSLGFRRKGKSRLWLSDHGYWLGVVEFQPSSFSKGTYCNVSVHWLWSLGDFLSFDYGLERVGSYAEFTDIEGFGKNVGKMALDAGRLAAVHAEKLTSLNAAAALMARREELLTGQGRPGDWGTFHAGVACGLVDDRAKARPMFERLLSKGDGAFNWELDRASLVRRLLVALDRHDEFQAMIQNLIDLRRRGEKLAPYVLPVRPLP